MPSKTPSEIPSKVRTLTALLVVCFAIISAGYSLHRDLSDTKTNQAKIDSQQDKELATQRELIRKNSEYLQRNDRDHALILQSLEKLSDKIDNMTGRTP